MSSKCTSTLKSTTGIEEAKKKKQEEWNKDAEARKAFPTTSALADDKG